MSISNEGQLISAADCGDLERVKSLCGDPAVNVNWQDRRGRTPFYCACQAGHVGVAEFLLSLKGIDLERPNNSGVTPFCMSCQNGRKEVVSLLLADPRLDPNKANKKEGTPFYMACQNGHKEVISLLLADPRIDPNKPRDTGTTPFSIACQEGHKEVVSLLLADPGVDPNKAQSLGATPFYMACQNGHRDVASLLLVDRRVDPNKLDNDQSSPLWQASQNGHLVIVQHLLASGREIDTRRRSTFNNKTAAEHGRAMGIAAKGDHKTEEDYERSKTNGPLCANLIDEYERDPVAVRHRLRRQPGLRESFIGHLYALVVFHSDSFVIINDKLAHSDTRRFFRICTRLPLEVQMIICNRAFDSPKDIILSRDSEPCFQLLDRSTTWQ